MTEGSRAALCGRRFMAGTEAGPTLYLPSSVCWNLKPSSSRLL